MISGHCWCLQCRPLKDNFSIFQDSPVPVPFFSPSRSTRTLSRKGPISDGIRRWFMFFLCFRWGCTLPGAHRQQQACQNLWRCSQYDSVLRYMIYIWYIYIYKIVYWSYSGELAFLTTMPEYVQPCSRSSHSCDGRRHLIVKSIGVSQLIVGWSHESSWCGIPTQKWDQQKRPAAAIGICLSRPQHVWNNDM